MDEMKIASKFTRGVVSKVLGVVLKTKFGYSADVQLNEFNAVVTDGKAHVHLNIDADMSQAELSKILASVGLG